jgi:SAM-dependent methyltransferase
MRAPPKRHIKGENDESKVRRKLGLQRKCAMNTTDRRAQWERVYASKGEREVSWFEETPAPSLEFLELVGANKHSAIIDIGGGASRLVDALISRDYDDVTVLDLSAAALAAAQERIGEAARRAQWLVADAVTWSPPRRYDIWHDRAAFHFLTDERDQVAYVERLRRALRADGRAIIATFAPDGPEKCSGLPVVRYDAVSLGRALGEGFVLLDTREHVHLTPWGSTQRFQFSAFRRGA